MSLLPSHEKIERICQKLNQLVDREMVIMEVCGTHTMAIARHAIRSLIPPRLKIISGPGCPVCVTDHRELALAIELARRPNIGIATFGDMMKIPCGQQTLQEFSNVRIIYSPMEALTWAQERPDLQIVLLGIGFETTTPLMAATVQAAQEQNIPNFSILPMHKRVPEAVSLILADSECRVDGLILPGHVSAVTGTDYYDFLRPYPVASVVVGFEALAIMEAITLLVDAIRLCKYEPINHYRSVVNRTGNPEAQAIVQKVYEQSDSYWREIGLIPGSGLRLRAPYQKFDAMKRFDLKLGPAASTRGCLCGAILMGKRGPHDCPHFAQGCTPAHPIGPCMVSSEGTCAAYYKYNITRVI